MKEETEPMLDEEGKTELFVNEAVVAVRMDDPPMLLDRVGLPPIGRLAGPLGVTGVVISAVLGESKPC